MHLWIQRGCKTKKKKKPLPSAGKRYTYLLHTYFIRSIHRASVHRDFIRAISFELHKTSRTDELSAVYDINQLHIRGINILCPLTSVKRPLYPLFIFWASSQLASAADENAKGGRGGQIRYMECLYIVCSTEIESMLAYVSRI